MARMAPQLGESEYPHSISPALMCPRGSLTGQTIGMRVQAKNTERAVTLTASGIRMHA